MSIYDKFADTPDRLRIEGQEITVKLVRNGDGTATIKWNIPNISGCNPEDLIYDGIVITVSNVPANYLSTSPKNGTYYNADPTFDPDLHAGDKIDNARVVGAFYHDKTTTSLTVTDVLPKTPYYVSAYAVDQVGNYYREGVHAYSLPTGQDELDKSQGETPAYHDVKIDTPEGVTPNTKTGLNRNQKYSLKLEINGKCYNITNIAGSNVQTYADLAKTLNRRFALLENPLRGPKFPNEGKFLVDEPGKKVFQWDGEKNVEQKSIFLPNDPSIPVLDTYWYKPSTDELRLRNSAGWALVTAVIKFPTNPSEPDCGTIWWDEVLESNGTVNTDLSIAWKWNGTTWCKRPTIIQERNPLLPPVLSCDDYWYNEASGEVFKRNISQRKWDEVDPIVWDKDPNSIMNGAFWYSNVSEVVKILLGGNWEDVTNIRYEEADAEGSIPFPVANHYWFDPSTQILRQRTADNSAWDVLDVIISANDPYDRNSCDLWWNVTPSINSLFVWDSVNNQWDAVGSFTQSEIDPAALKTLEPGTIWFNPVTRVMQEITGVNCTNVIYIESAYDPTNLPFGVVWYKTITKEWFVWDGNEFVPIDVIEAEHDPYDVFDGVFWFNGTKLFLREGGAWVEQEFSTTSLAPKVGTQFYDTINDKLLQWDGMKWVDGKAIARVDLYFNRELCGDDAYPNPSTDLFSPYNDFDEFGRDIIRFSTRKLGCEATIDVDRNTRSILTYLNKPIIWFAPATGRSRNEAGPTYKEIGAGDDGSPDERRKLHDQIRVALGALSVQVELTKQQLDECVDNALLMVRQYSSYSYRRAFFFLDVYPNQQSYLLINKCVGFNKIISVNAGYRMRTGFLGASSGTFGGYDIYGYAALQQLYSLGTFDMLSYHLVSSYIEDLQYLFADNLVFTFYEDTRLLKFTQIFYNYERILLDASIEVPEQQLITNRHLALWIKKWATAEAKMMLSQVRGKYQTLPGPNGSTTLNSQELITQSENEKAELREELKDRSFQDENVGVKAQFFIG